MSAVARMARLGQSVGAPERDFVARLWLVWNRRGFVIRVCGLGLALSALTAFLIPKQFQSTARLMPPDQANSEMEILASAASTKAGNGLGSVANSLLGLKSSGALFVGILREPNGSRRHHRKARSAQDLRGSILGGCAKRITNEHHCF